MHTERDPRLNAIPDIHGHAKGEHKPYAEERPLPLTARMLFLWFYHACRRGWPRFMMVTDHMNALTFEDPASVNLVRRALKLAQAGDLYGAAETANVDVAHAQVVSDGLRRGMRYSIGAEVDNDPRARPDAQNIVEAMRPDGLIRSVHFIPIDHPVHGPNWNWPFDNPEFASAFEHVGLEKTWELYMGVLLDALERLPGHIVGHFYVPAILGQWPDPETLEKYEDQMLDIVEQKGMAVEFNTRFLYRDHTDDEKQRYLDANRRLLRKAKDRGVGIAIGSDAHSPRDQGGAFETVLGVLDELEINELVFPIGGRLLRVALRYVKPPEPEPAPPPPAPPAPEPATLAPAASEAARPAAAAKPVRKARPAASSVRPKDGAPERPAGETPFEAPATGTVAAELPPQSQPAKPPKKPAKAAAVAPPEPAEPAAEPPAPDAAHAPEPPAGDAPDPMRLEPVKPAAGKATAKASGASSAAKGRGVTTDAAASAGSGESAAGSTATTDVPAAGSTGAGAEQSVASIAAEDRPAAAAVTPEPALPKRAESDAATAASLVRVEAPPAAKAVAKPKDGKPGLGKLPSAAAPEAKAGPGNLTVAATAAAKPAPKAVDKPAPATAAKPKTASAGTASSKPAAKSGSSKPAAKAAPRATAKSAAKKAVSSASKRAPAAAAPVKKAAAKKSAPATKAAPSKKAAAKKSAPPKKAAPAKKSAGAKKPVAKKAPSKAAGPARKGAPVKKAPAKKASPAKKAAAKKPGAKRR